MIRRTALVGVLVLALLGACGGSSGGDRGSVAAAIAADGQKLIDAAAKAGEHFATSVTELCANTNGDRLAALDALHDARGAWRRAEVFWFGPAMTRFANSQIDGQPKLSDVDAILQSANPPTIDTRSLGGFGSDTRGYGAAEIALSRPSVEGRTCAFLIAAAELASNELAGTAREWRTAFGAGKGYAKQLEADPMMTFNELINSVLETLNRIGSREIGLATGELGVSKKPDPSVLIEGPSGWSTDDLRARLDGIGVALFGDGDEEDATSSLLGKSLAARLRTEFDAIVDAVDALKRPLRSVLADDPAELTALRRKMVELEKTVATEVVARLGVTVGFSDGDGDSAG